MPESLDVGSPLWWLRELESRLHEQQTNASPFLDYYDGNQPISSITTQKYREAFAKLVSAICDNWCPIVVDAVEERLHVEGFRFGDRQGDQDAWDIWQRNFLDADSEIVHSVALVAGSASVMVWPGEDGEPEITVEHPTQMIVVHEPGRRRRRTAALKLWEDAGTEYATLYLPAEVWKFQRKGSGTSAGKWVPRANVEERIVNPFGVVPVVPMLNRPTMFGYGRSELKEILSTQDQINKLVADMVIASEFAAFRQRWATGVEVPTDPATGEEMEPFESAVNRVWHVPDENARFGEFTETDLRGYVAAIENRVQSLASRSRTPPHYLLGGSGVFPSGESLKATETGLIAKVRSRQRHFGETWEEVLRLAFRLKGDPRSTEYRAETIWRDPESRTEGEHIDSLLKKLSIGVPIEQLWEDAGYSPEQIRRFKEMAVEEAKRRIELGIPVADDPATPSTDTPPPDGE